MAAVSPADGREPGGSNQEDLSQVTEGDPAEDPSPAGGDEVEGDMVGNNEEETNYNKSLLSYFRQQTLASHSDNLYSTVERTAAVNSVDNRDSAVDDDGHVADGDSWHGDDHVDTVPSEGEVSTGDRLTTTAHQSKTPNIFEAAKEKSNMPILWRFVGLKHILLRCCAFLVAAEIIIQVIHDFPTKSIFAFLSKCCL